MWKAEGREEGFPTMESALLDNSEVSTTFSGQISCASCGRGTSMGVPATLTPAKTRTKNF